jgi:hypothetical protein
MQELDKTRIFHYVWCAAMKEVKVDPKVSPEVAWQLGIIAMSSEQKIADALKAVRRSPFKTVFVIEPKTGTVSYALSQNEAYVAAAKKKGGGGGGSGRPPLPPSPVEECCNFCQQDPKSAGCLVDENLSCWCLYTDRQGSSPGEIGTEDPLEILSPN